MSASIPDHLGLPAGADRVKVIAGVGGVLALILAVLLGSSDWSHFFRAYLVGFIFVTSISLGGLFFTLVQHATRAGWSVTVRRLSEFAASNFLWIWILFLPVLIMAILGRGGELYEWMDADIVARDELLQHKAPYLNPGFWLARAVFYLGLWAAFGWFFLKHSLAQDRDGEVEHTHRMQALAPVAALLFALTQTFAALDWIMSLSPHWFSTIFGVYFFAASCCGFFASLILTVYFLQRSGRLLNEITLEHYQDMGKLLFAFGIVFWAYIGFSQYILIWYGNIPEETGWYIARSLGPWAGWSFLLLLGHFCLPFLLLATKHTKRVKGVIAAIAGWMLLMHAVDCYWLVMPKVPGGDLHGAANLKELQALASTGEFDRELGHTPAIADLLCIVGIALVYVAGSIHRMKGHALIPTADPRLNEAIAFENM